MNRNEKFVDYYDESGEIVWCTNGEVEESRTKIEKYLKDIMHENQIHHRNNQDDSMYENKSNYTKTDKVVECNTEFKQSIIESLQNTLLETNILCDSLLLIGHREYMKVKYNEFDRDKIEKNSIDSSKQLITNYQHNQGMIEHVVKLFLQFDIKKQGLHRMMHSKETLHELLLIKKKFNIKKVGDKYVGQFYSKDGMYNVYEDDSLNFKLAFKKKNDIEENYCGKSSLVCEILPEYQKPCHFLITIEEHHQNDCLNILHRSSFYYSKVLKVLLSPYKKDSAIYKLLHAKNVAFLNHIFKIISHEAIDYGIQIESLNYIRIPIVDNSNISLVFSMVSSKKASLIANSVVEVICNKEQFSCNLCTLADNFEAFIIAFCEHYIKQSQCFSTRPKRYAIIQEEFTPFENLMGKMNCYKRWRKPLNLIDLLSSMVVNDQYNLWLMPILINYLPCNNINIDNNTYLNVFLMQSYSTISIDDMLKCQKIKNSLKIAISVPSQLNHFKYNLSLLVDHTINQMVFISDTCDTFSTISNNQTLIKNSLDYALQTIYSNFIENILNYYHLCYYKKDVDNVLTFFDIILPNFTLNNELNGSITTENYTIIKFIINMEKRASNYSIEEEYWLTIKLFYDKSTLDMLTNNNHIDMDTITRLECVKIDLKMDTIIKYGDYPYLTVDDRHYSWIDCLSFLVYTLVHYY